MTSRLDLIKSMLRETPGIQHSRRFPWPFGPGWTGSLVQAMEESHKRWDQAQQLEQARRVQRSKWLPNIHGSI